MAVELHISLTRLLGEVETVRPAVDRGTGATIDGQEGVRQGCVRERDSTTGGRGRRGWDYGLAGSARDHRDGLDRDEADDGKGKEAGVNGAEGGLELAVSSKLIVWELFARAFNFLLHEKKFLHSGQFLGIGRSGKDPADIVDRKP